MQYETWNFENDSVVTKRKRLFPENTARNYMGTAYAVETEKGIFYQKLLPNGQYNLNLVDTAGERIFMEDVAVVASDMKYSCIIVHVNQTGEFFLIDTRGILFLLEISQEKLYPAEYSMHLDRKSGYYCVGTRTYTRWMIRSVTKEKQFTVMLNSAPTGEWTLNPKFKSVFSKKMAGDYLYLTILNSKKGRIIDYLISHELPYEDVPNLFLEDTSRNIRIPINEETMKTQAMNFLTDKYTSTYAIAGIPIETFLGTMHLSYKISSSHWIRFSPASESQYPKVMSIINTLKMLYGVNTDEQLYKKLFKRILSLFIKPMDIPYENSFGKLLLPYPETGEYGMENNKQVVRGNIEYINTVLFPENPIKDVDAIDIFTYKAIYTASKQYYKTKLVEFESDVLSRII